MRVFGGRPTAVSFSGVFLPSTDWELKIEGTSWRSLEAVGEHGALIRSMRRSRSGTLKPTQVAALDQMLADIPDGESVRVFRAAVGGDESAIEAIQSWRPWRLFGMGVDARLWPHVGAYVALEQKLEEADAALLLGDFPKVAELLASSEELRPYWSDLGLNALRVAKQVEDTMLPRLIACLELQVSCVARATSSERFVMGSEERAILDALLDQPQLRPGQQLLHWLKQYVGVGSLSALLKIAEDGNPSGELPSEATFKRWCSGTVFPPSEHMREFALALQQGVGVGRATKFCVRELSLHSISAAYWATRRLEHAIAWVRWIESQPVGGEHLIQIAGNVCSRTWGQRAYSRWSMHWRNSGDGACSSVY